MISPKPRFAGVDPALIGLALAFDLEAVSTLYEDRWGSRAAGFRVVARGVHDVDHEPWVRCRVSHELTLERPGDETRKTFGVIDVRTTGPSLRSFDEDPDLPWLPDACDPSFIGPHLRVRGLGPESQITRVVPVRYKAGSRCVLRLDSEGDPLYAKVLATTDVERLVGRVRALREVPCLLQPLGHSADLHMILLPAVLGGTELHRLAFDAAVPSESRLHWIRRAGAALASLHAARVPAGPPLRIVDDARALGEFSTPLARTDPELQPRFEALVRLFLATSLDEGPAVPSHGAFRTDQVMVNHSEPMIIDLDSLCWANPARDIGNFQASLRWKAIRERHHADFIHAAMRAFIDGYATVRTVPDERWTTRYEAGSMLKLAGRRFRKLSVNEWPLVPRLLDEAETLLRLSESLTTARCPDPMMPGPIRAASDPKTMTARLRLLMGRPGRHRRHPVVTKAELLGEKPEHRWTFRYTLAGGRDKVVGKMYRDPVRGRRTYETMRWLRENDVAVPRPLGWIADLAMLAYHPAPGRLLGDTLLDEGAAADMDQTAAWLSALHRSELPLDRTFDVPTELQNLCVWASIVGNRHPDLARPAGRISTRLAELRSELGAESSRPIHKDFHHQHVFVSDRVHVIDLDEVRLGDPAFDVAHFCAYLRLLGLRLPAMAARLDQRRDEFLAAYRRHSDCELNGSFAPFSAYTCLKIAKQLCTSRGLVPRPHADEEHRQTAAILQEGLTALDCG